jgi:hypothetical protein
MLAIWRSARRCLRAVDRACPANLDDHRVSPANPPLQRCQPFKRGVRQRTLLDRGERILELLRRRRTDQDGAHHRMRDRKPRRGFREACGKTRGCIITAPCGNLARNHLFVFAFSCGITLCVISRLSRD